jgi:hypothetical protein
MQWRGGVCQLGVVCAIKKPPDGAAVKQKYLGTYSLAEPKLAKRAAGGGARRDRTADLVNAIHALSHLSYGP